MPDANHAGLSPAFVEAVAGLSAGSMATLIVHPLDIVKTRMQIHRSTAAVPTRLTTWALLGTMLQTDHPVAALYRGLTPNLLGNATSWASFFFFKSRAERAIAALKGGADTRSTADPVVLSPMDYFLASGASGVAVQVITNPIWVLKTRMLSSDRGAAGAYPSMWEGARRLLRDEGVRGFYRGLGVSLFGVSHGAVQFAVYDPVKRVYLARRQRWQLWQKQDQDQGQNQRGMLGQRQQQDAASGGGMSNEATVVISTLSKLVAGAVTYPYQVVRSRLQNYDAEVRFGRGIGGVAGQLWREEGIRGFYRGLVPGVVRVMPATWVTFLVYENVRYYLPTWFG